MAIMLATNRQPPPSHQNVPRALLSAVVVAVVYFNFSLLLLLSVCQLARYVWSSDKVICWYFYQIQVAWYRTRRFKHYHTITSQVCKLCCTAAVCTAAVASTLLLLLLPAFALLPQQTDTAAYWFLYRCLSCLKKHQVTLIYVSIS